MSLATKTTQNQPVPALFKDLILAAGLDPNGNLIPLQVDASGNLNSNGSAASASASVYGVTGTASAHNQASAAASRGVTIKADQGNNGSVYVGTTSGVTADSGNATSGFRLTSGESVLFSVNNANLLWVICTDGSQLYTVSLI